MSHLEQRLEHDLNEIREHIASMGADVEQGLDNAFSALQTADEKLAFTTILSDHPINRKMRKIDKLCHAFIAVHLPSAGHLRFLSSVIRANIILERIGDYAVTIARESVQMGSAPEGRFAPELSRISSEVRLVLHESISAFNDLNTEQARSTIKLSNQVEHNMDGIYAELLDRAEKGDTRNSMICLIIFSQLKRVADQAKNLAEETIFAETGETKAPKVYRILFLDKDNSCVGPMAELIARKIFPEVGYYRSEGVSAADSLDANMVDFMQSRSFDLTAIHPAQLDASRESLADYHVIVGLNQPVLTSIDKIPFRTSVLNWNDNSLPNNDDAEAWEALYKNLAFQIRELIILLRGEETI